MKPTRTRYWVVVFAVTLAILSYIDRVCISQAAPDIRRDLGLDKAQMGSVFAAFGLAYAAFEIPGGWLGDWMGPRKVLIRIVTCWSAFTALTGWTFSLTSLWIVRFLFGAGEAGCFPNLTKAFSTWLPPVERVRAQGILWTFARWGGAFTPPLVNLAYQFMSWRWAFVAFGTLGVMWAIVFSMWFRDRPRDHPHVNAAELRLLEGVEGYATGHGDVPWGKLVSSRSVWFLWIQYFCMSFPWYFYITWLPTYLQEYWHLSPGESSRLAILPLLFGGFGALFCGLISARVTRVLGSLTHSRRLLATTGFVGGCVFLLVTAHAPTAYWAILAMATASFFNDLIMPPAWGTCMDIGTKYAGTVSGSMNMMGNFAGFAAPWIGGILVERSGGNWNNFIYLMAAMYLIGSLCWWMIDPETPIENLQ